MDLRQLKYFIAVAEERHFGRAAARLHLSQPPLTRQIQALEEELGAALFKRTPRGVELTQAGEALLADARNIRSLVDQATTRARLAGRGHVGRLDIGLYGTAIYDVLPRLLIEFHDAHPDVQLSLHHGATPEQLTALRQGRVELVFERRVPREDDIEVELVAREAVYVALGKGHRLAALDAIAIEDLRDDSWIMPAAPQSQMSNAALELCRARGFEPRIAERVDDMITGLLLTALDAGVQLVPVSATAVRVPGVDFRPLVGNDETYINLYCFYLKRESSPLRQVMLDVIRDFRRREERRLRMPASLRLPARSTRD